MKFRERERETGDPSRMATITGLKKITPAELIWATMYPAIAANQRAKVQNVWVNS